MARSYRSRHLRVMADNERRMAALRAATDEHAQIVGVATALGASEAQLWAAMVA